ncbi:MAG: DeoR/GlpR family DNA-binding transcription regulator [Clostridiaceae bacterium]
MLAKERLLYVLERLNTQPSVSIQKLSDELGVSISTIQRDLKTLENQGKIQRERGGAVKKELGNVLSGLSEMPVVEKEMVNVPQKESVCERAAELIKDGDCIFIDSGTTPTNLVPFLTYKKIKIVTNSNFLLKKLSKEFKGEVYLLGGQFNFNYDMSFGPITLEEVSRFHFDHAFLGVSGIDIDSGEVFTTEFDIGAIKSAVMKRSNHKYLLMDDSKYYIKGLCTWAEIKDFDSIFVNAFPLKKKKPKNMIVCE